MVIDEIAFRLHPKNRLALDVYENTVMLSGFDFSGMSTFSKLEFILENMTEDMKMTNDEYRYLLRKVGFMRAKFTEYSAQEQKAKAGGK